MITVGQLIAILNNYKVDTPVAIQIVDNDITLPAIAGSIRDISLWFVMTDKNGEPRIPNGQDEKSKNRPCLEALIIWTQ